MILLTTDAFRYSCMIIAGSNSKSNVNRYFPFQQKTAAEGEVKAKLSQAADKWTTFCHPLLIMFVSLHSARRILI